MFFGSETNVAFPDDCLQMSKVVAEIEYEVL